MTLFFLPFCPTSRNSY